MNKRKKKIVIEEVNQKHDLTLPAIVVVSINLIPKADTRTRGGYVYALRMKGWTLQAVGDALDLTRERIRQIESGANPIDVIAVLSDPGRFPVPEVPKIIIKREVAVYTEPSAESLKRLLELQPLAQQVRSFSPKHREVAEEYTTLLNYVHTVEGVPLYRLAMRLGVTHGALRFRLVRYGYMESDGKSKSFKKVMAENRFTHE